MAHARKGYGGGGWRLAVGLIDETGRCHWTERPVLPLSTLLGFLRAGCFEMPLAGVVCVNVEMLMFEISF